MRAKLVRMIDKYAGEEMTINDWIQVGQLSDEELLDWFCHIVERKLDKDYTI